MKKQTCYVLLLVLFIINIHAQGVETLETNPAYIYAKKQVEFLRQSFFTSAKKAAQRGATIGAAAGAGLGIGFGYSTVQKDYPKLQAQHPQRAQRLKIPYKTAVIGGSGVMLAVSGAAGGAVLGAAISETKRRYTIWYINDSLSLTKYNLMTMPMHEAIMVYAAYQKNVPLMKKMKPQVENFLKDRGVWAALAELYFGELQVSANIATLKKTLAT